MTYAEFQEHFERAAALERQRFDAMPVDAVISEIRAGRLGQYYQIWYSLGARATPVETNSLLLSFLASEAAYLDRYHCAAALIQINKLKSWGPQDLSASRKYPVAENLATIRAQLDAV
jgi:hypothetical protein